MKKTISVVIAILLITIIATIYKFNYLEDKQDYYVVNTLCDENGNRYKNDKEAKKAGLLEAEYGATYCPEYKMDPSWDINKDGINDCYENNSCSKELEYMSPRVK